MRFVASYGIYLEVKFLKIMFLLCHNHCKTEFRICTSHFLETSNSTPFEKCDVLLISSEGVGLSYLDKKIAAAVKHLQSTIIVK